MSSISRGKRSSGKLKTMGNDDEFLTRITKSLYYSKLPRTDRLSLPVTEFAAELFSEVKSGCTLDRLDVEEASRISRNACVSPCSFVLALLYLERLKDCNPEYLYKVAPSELFLVSLMIASKFLNDDGEEDEVFNTEWANSADLPVPHINRLEKEFLDAINWKIFVHNQDFWDRLKKLEDDVAYKEGKKRGWFSYHELSQLIETIRITALVQALVSISSICLATYTAGVVTLLGSALIASSIPGISLAPKSQNLSFNSTKNPILSSGDDNLKDKLKKNDFSEDLNEDFHHFSTSEGNFSIFKDNFSIFKGNFSIFKGNFSTSDHNFSPSEHNFHGSEAGNDSWQWWMSPIANWVKYDEENYRINDIHTQYDFVSSFVTNSQALIGKKDYKAFDDFVTEINWKETVNDHFQDSRSNWMYYIELVTKISIGHQH